MKVEKIAYALPQRLLFAIENVNEIDSINEIRIRIDKPIILLLKNKKVFLNHDGTTGEKLLGNEIIATKQDVSDVFARLCEHSMYSREGMINSGYIAMRYGCRAGICGRFSDKDFNLQNVQSINIRIARQVDGADLSVFYLMQKKLKSVLISGPPGCGKTTVLRELCRRFSNEMNNVCVLDEKGEIAGEGANLFDMGVCTDVISFRSKSDAAAMALKYMNPDVIAFDELADDSGVIRNCVKCGVKIFATIHADSIDDAVYRLDNMSVDINAFDLAVLFDKNKMNVIDSKVISR